MMQQLLLILCVVSIGSSQAFSYEGYRVVTAGPMKNQGDTEIIQAIVNDDERIRQIMLYNDEGTTRIGEPVELIVSSEAFSMLSSVLTKNGIAFTVTNDNLQQALDSSRSRNADSLRRMRGGISNFKHDAYLSYADQVSWINNIVSATSSIAQTVNFGKSYEGRDMIGLRINHGKKKLPIIWIDSNIHAREWLSSATTLYIIEQLLTAKTERAAYLRKNFRWYIMPMANPDGYAFTWTNDRMWRKTRSINNGTSCVGVDPNRNFATNFGGEGTRKDPCSEIYHGPKAFSEPETANIAAFLKKIAHVTNVMITIHCYSQVWLVPWGYQKNHSADYNELMRVGTLAINAIKETNGKTFTIGTPPDVMYVASGGSFDWAKQELGIKYSYGPELRPTPSGGNGFDIPATNIIPSGQEIFAAIEAVARNAKHKI